MSIITQFVKWIRSLFFKKTATAKQVVGVGYFDGEAHSVVRKNRKLFFVSVREGSEKHITMTSSLARYAANIKDVQVLNIEKGYGLVGTVSDKGLNKTIYAQSLDGKHFKTVSLVEHPEGTPSKILLQKNGDVCLLTSIEGELMYRNVDPSSKHVHYKDCNIAPRNDSFDHSPLSIVHAEFLDDGIFVIYESSYELRGYKNHVFGAALLNHDDLSHVHWRATWEQTPYWEQFVPRGGESKLNARTLGAYVNEDMVHVYFVDDDSLDLYGVELQQPYARRDPRTDRAHLNRHEQNPVVKPNPNNAWEDHNTFNPTALLLNEKVHLLYRAEGSAGLSVIGYGESNDGYHFNQLADPVYVPRMNFEGVGVPRHYMTGRYRSGYRNYPIDAKFRWHGVEDPRATILGDRMYMIYAAYNGYQMARPAITSISLTDFENKNWNWMTPIPMTTQPQYWGDGNKNVVLHPQKVHGKFMLYHRIWPHIRIDYVDDLDFGEGKKWLKEIDTISARGDSWDSERVGISACPIEIDEGWLVIYQGSGSQDRRYKVGAMILDKDNPSEVLYRSNYPILAPETWYENENKAGVAYPCGVVVHDGTLKVYYGGSDRYVCVAQSPIRDFVDQLKRDPYEKPVLRKVMSLR